jgi:hypothetical protein
VFKAELHFIIETLDDIRSKLAKPECLEDRNAPLLKRQAHEETFRKDNKFSLACDSRAHQDQIMSVQPHPTDLSKITGRKKALAHYRRKKG